MHISVKMYREDLQIIIKSREIITNRHKEKNMTVTDRQAKILELLASREDITVRELARELNFSESTVRRDFTELERGGFISKLYGGARLTKGRADGEIPFLLRENERSEAKLAMARRAANLVRDGMVLMLDGSTSAYYVVPFLTKFKDLIVVTSGAKTAVALAEANIQTFATGGQMIIHSFSYVGAQAESFVRSVNADLLLFSCRGLSDDGKMTDVSIEEANLRRVMLAQSKKKVLLCDSSKLGKVCFYNMGDLTEVDAVICDTPERLPEISK